MRKTSKTKPPAGSPNGGSALPSSDAIVVGWTWEDKESPFRLCRYVTRIIKSQPVGAYEPVLPFNVVPQRAWTVDEHVVSVEVDIIWPDRHTRRYTLPTKLESETRPAPLLRHETGIILSHKEACQLGDFLGAIANRATTDLETEELVTEARWRGGKFEVPPDLINTRGEEESAREAWRKIVEAAVKHPKLAIMLGAAMAPPFLVRYEVELPAFFVHVYGDGNSGKTMTERTAIATRGNPSDDVAAGGLLNSWDTTKNAALSTVAESPLLAVAFDDTSKVSGRDSARFLRDIIYAVSGGQERGRNDRDGVKRPVRSFRTVVLSSGEGPMIGDGPTGQMSRVIDLAGPTVRIDPNGDPDHEHARQKSAKTQRALANAASRHYGWPLKWLTEREWTDDMLIDLPSYTDPGDPLERFGQCVAMAAVGFDVLAKVCGVPDVDADAIGKANFEEIAERYRDIGVSSAQRFWDALPDYVTRHGRSIQIDSTIGEVEYERADLVGRRFDNGDVALVPSAAREIAELLGLSLDTILPALDREERLNRGEKLQIKQRIGGKPERVYHFVGVYDDTSGGTEPESETTHAESVEF